jgi:ring-1,2-phenylacetyl-CoA epoxidase subunit PaaC
MQTAVNELWSFTGEMFAADVVEERLATQNIASNPATLRESWLEHVTEMFRAATLTLPNDTWMQQGGKQGRHTEHLGYLLAEMQFLQRAYPGAKW